MAPRNKNEFQVLTLPQLHLSASWQNESAKHHQWQTVGSCKGQGEPTSNGTTVSFNDLPSTLHHPLSKHQLVQTFQKITKRPLTTPTNKHVHFSLVFCLVFLVFLGGAWWGTCVFAFLLKVTHFPPPSATAPKSSGRSKRPVRGPATMAPTKAPTPPAALGLAGRANEDAPDKVDLLFWSLRNS